MPTQPCQPGCTCGRHKSSACKPGCTCKRHARTSVIDWKDPEAVRTYARLQSRERYATDPEKIKANTKRYRDKMKAADPDYWRKRQTQFDRAWRYGLPREQFFELLGSQSGHCYLCRSLLDPEARRGAHLDHEHNCCPGSRTGGQCTGGLTCDECNTGIGAFGDVPELLRLVADNLQAAIERLNR